MNWEVGTDIPTLVTMYMKQMANENPPYTAQGTLLNAPRGLTWKGNPIYVHIWPSHFVAQQKRTLQSNYIPTKINIFLIYFLNFKIFNSYMRSQT